MRRTAKSVPGFSLLEVLVALAVFSVGVMAIASMQSTITRSTGFTGVVTRAEALARDRIEIMQAAPRDEIMSPSSDSMLRCGEDVIINGAVMYDPRCTATYVGTYRIDLTVEVNYPMSMRTYGVRLDSSRFVSWP